MIALPQQRGQTPSGRGEGSYRRRRAEQRARQRQRLAEWSRAGNISPSLCPDPLIRPRRAWGRRLGLTGMLIGASVVAHGAAVFGLALFSGILERGDGFETRPDERLEVAMIEHEPPKIEEPDELPDKKTERSVIRKLPDEQPPTAPEPPPDPTEEQAPPEPQRRRVVGLSFESTVVGSGGPAFAVGNTRMGETDRVASDPELATKPPRRNTVSQRVPTASVKFDPPEKRRGVVPDYPPQLKAQGIEADVVLRVTVGVDGEVQKVAILKGARDPEFNDSAVRAAKRETYHPARRNGGAVEHTIKFTVRFRLTDY